MQIGSILNKQITTIKELPTTNEVLENTEGLNASQTIQEIAEYYKKIGRPECAASIVIFGDVVILDNQLNTLALGKSINTEAIERNGLPIIIRQEETTQEMINNGCAVLVTDGRLSILGHNNLLRNYLNRHINGEVSNESTKFANLLTQPLSLIEDLVTGRKNPLYTTHLQLQKEERMAIRNLLNLNKNTSKEHLKTILTDKIARMMKKRPGIVNLVAVDYFNKRLVKEYESLSTSNTDGSYSIKRFTDLHEYMMNSRYIKELGIDIKLCEHIIETVKRALIK